jgi:hypothetical protein
VISKSIFYSFFFLFAVLCSSAQTYSIQGRVVDAVTNTPLHKASVYINNTTKGAIANDSGYFSIPFLPAGTYELILSFVGYKTTLVRVQLAGADYNGVLKLQPEQKQLREVLIITKATRTRYLELFRKNVLGFTRDAGKCVIKNPDAIQFVQGKTKNDLFAFAEDPVIIENPVLGYTIYFTIQEVYLNTSTGVSYFFGYTKFDDWMTAEAVNKKWMRNRRNVYMGSSMHFFRSLVNKELFKQGFAMNTVAEGVEAVRENRITVQTSGSDATVSNVQWSGGTVMAPVKEDSVLTPAGTDAYKIFELNLNKQLYIKYKLNTGLKLQLISIMPVPGQPENGTMSALRLKSAPVKIDYRGILLTPMNVFFDGVWAYERLANMLPEDYEPEK